MSRGGAGQSGRQPDEDAILARLAMEGDRDAFERLYRRWHGRLLRHAARLTGDADLAQDVLQAAALAIARNVHRLRTPESFGPWAYRIVRHRTADAIRQRQRDRRLKQAFEAEPLPAPAVADAEEESEPTAQMAAALRTLRPADREILSAFYTDDMAVAEIATCFGIQPGTVKSRLFNARQRLKAALGEAQGDDHE